MEPSINQQPSQSFWHRRWKALLGIFAGLIVLAAVSIYAYLLATSTPITADQQRTALLALQGPSGARLHLGFYGDSDRWYAPADTDFAVQDGMAIFPEPITREKQAALGLSQVELPVLVYAPNGGSLSTRPGPPIDRYIDANEWFLYKCRPILPHPAWWECGLLFGDAIQH